MPDLNPKFTGKTIRQNGSWGKGITAANFTGISYLAGAINDPTPGNGVPNGSTKLPCASTAGPYCNSNPYMFGDAPRTMAYDGLRNPSSYGLDGSVSRTFDITERLKFVFRADCQNIPNKVTFSKIATNMDATNFGTVGGATGNGGSRDFQFSGRINF